MRQLEFGFSNHYKILAEASGGKLTEQEVYNLETYGVKHPSEFAPDPTDEPAPGYCVCGTKDCATEYACVTSGY
tara:strand:+ start:41 stop:262 length:222 start_codon:yes stop_codon:yes gene_type:complete